MSAPVVAGTVALMLQANPVAHAERGQGDPAVHRAGVSGYDPLTAGRRIPQREGRRGARAIFRSAGGAAIRRRRLERPADLGQPPRRRAAASRLPRTRGRRTSTWGRRTRRTTVQEIEWGVAAAPTRRLRDDVPDALCMDAGDGYRERRLGNRRCGGADCTGPVAARDDRRWGTATTTTRSCGAPSDDDDTVVWGTDDDDTVVWGTSCTRPGLRAGRSGDP